MTTRHEFLRELHQLIKPKTYLEIGVQFGHSLRLATDETYSIAIDPHPHVHPQPRNTTIHHQTSDAFFADNDPSSLPKIDLVFIDGMHLYEFALRDFNNVETVSHKGTIIVFDDVLPRNQAEASRDMCPGDWTGDVWKVIEILRQTRPDLTMWLVDVEPTGLLVIGNVNSEAKHHATTWPLGDTVPDDVLTRKNAVQSDEALAEITVLMRKLRND